MNELNEATLRDVSGGEDLPVGTSYRGPSEAAIAAILALLSHPIPVHTSD